MNEKREIIFRTQIITNRPLIMAVQTLMTYTILKNLLKKIRLSCYFLLIITRALIFRISQQINNRGILSERFYAFWGRFVLLMSRNVPWVTQSKNIYCPAPFQSFHIGASFCHTCMPLSSLLPNFSRSLRTSTSPYVLMLHLGLMQLFLK